MGRKSKNKSLNSTPSSSFKVSNAGKKKKPSPVSESKKIALKQSAEDMKQAATSSKVPGKKSSSSFEESSQKIMKSPLTSPKQKKEDSPQSGGSSNKKSTKESSQESSADNESCFAASESSLIDKSLSKWARRKQKKLQKQQQKDDSSQNKKTEMSPKAGKSTLVDTTHGQNLFDSDSDEDLEEEEDAKISLEKSGKEDGSEDSDSVEQESPQKGNLIDFGSDDKKIGEEEDEDSDDDLTSTERSKKTGLKKRIYNTPVSSTKSLYTISDTSSGLDIDSDEGEDELSIPYDRESDEMERNEPSEDEESDEVDPADESPRKKAKYIQVQEGDDNLEIIEAKLPPR